MATYIGKQLKFTDNAGNIFKLIPVDSTEKGAANGVATLDEYGKVLSTQLPSYVDDVLEYDSKDFSNWTEWVASTSYEVGNKVKVTVIEDEIITVTGYICKTTNESESFIADEWEEATTFPVEGEKGKIYIALDTNKTYRWSGSAYVAIASDLALGTTEYSAFRGDYGAAAYAAAVTNIESTPTNNSSNLITSGAVYTGLSNKADKADTVLDTTLSRGRKDGSTVGTASFAFGVDVTASGDYSHARGVNTISSGIGSHAEGFGGTFSLNGTTYTSGAVGAASHAEGMATRAAGSPSHAEGQTTIASGNQSHAEGFNTIASGSGSHAEGYGGTFSLDGTTYTSGALGTADHTEGYYTLTASNQPGNHAEGYCTRATGGAAHAEGSTTLASGVQSHAEGYYTTASAAQSHAEGYNAMASGIQSHAEGYNTIASVNQAHAEGSNTTASGGMAHAEGFYTIASGDQSHVEGFYTIATGVSSHVSGMYNVTDSYDNWPEWTANTSYSVGDKIKRTTTSNNQTTVTGYVCKTANNDSSFTSSKWTNQYGKMNFAEIIGNGTANNALSNARALDWNGNEHLMGDIYVGCNADSTGGTKLTAPIGMTGADGTNAGTAGYVPAPAATDNTKYLKGDGTWSDVDALPAVTSSDNGKVLAVANGSWTTSNVPEPVFPIHKEEFTLETTDWEVVTGGYQASISIQDIDSNSFEFTIYDSSIADNLVGNISCEKDSTNHEMIFTVSSMPTGDISGTIIYVKGSSIISTGMPDVPTNDGTYFLQCNVSNGIVSYNWAEIPVANGVSF